MHNPDEPRQTRRLRFPRRRITWFLLAVGVVTVALVPAALANHLFSDVPAASPHHGAVSALAGAGITAGCAPGLYCPANNVRRDEMASFLQRGLGRNGASGTTAPITLTGTFADIAQDSITAGGAAGGTGFVMLFGSFTAIAGNDLSIESRIEFRFVEDATGFTSNVNSVTLEPSINAFPSASPAKQWVFSIPTGTTRTYSLQARVAFAPPAGQDINAESRLISVLYVPFGSSGTSSLGNTTSGGVTSSKAGEGQ